MGCLNCHREAQIHGERLKQELSVKYDAPLGTKGQRLFYDSPEIIKVKSAAKALHCSASKIPEKRRNELLAVIKNYCGPDVFISEEVIKRLSKMDSKVKNENYDGSSGKKVVDTFLNECKLADFIRMWRQNFLTNMQPKHLPPMWSVEHNLKKLHEKEVSFTLGVSSSKKIL